MERWTNKAQQASHTEARCARGMDSSAVSGRVTCLTKHGEAAVEKSELLQTEDAIVIVIELLQSTLEVACEQGAEGGL